VGDLALSGRGPKVELLVGTGIVFAVLQKGKELELIW